FRDASFMYCGPTILANGVGREQVNSASTRHHKNIWSAMNLGLSRVTRLPVVVHINARMASTSSPTSIILPLKRPRESSVPAQSEVSQPAPATSQRFKNSIVLAPMHGATLVWGPEIVDRAMLHAKRVVDAERPYLIYQIGSSTPSLAVAAALLVSRDVSGVDLNCGCPKPFSTSGGMGAALLDTPDILCEILTSLRKALPAHISVSCKIRLLPDQGKTLELVKRIVKTGIRERAIIERLKEIVDFVHGMKDDNGNQLDIAVLANGDVEGWNDMMRVRDITGADGVMVATKAEENPTCFSEQMLGVEDLVAKYTSNAFGNTKHCISSFKSAPGLLNQKSTLKVLRNLIASAKDYEGLRSLVHDRHVAEVARGSHTQDFDEETWGGEREVEEFVKSIKSRSPPAWWVGVEEWERLNPDIVRPEGMSLDENGIKELLEREKEERPRKKSKVDKGAAQTAVEEVTSMTPAHTTNPEIGALGTPGPIFATYVPPLVAGRNERSPSPERPVSNAATLVGLYWVHRSDSDNSYPQPIQPNLNPIIELGYGPHAVFVGTSSIIDEVTHQPLLSILSAVVETCVKLRSKGHKVVLVSSGAIGVGMKRMKLPSKPKALSGRQALAAIGQGRLIALWDNLFSHLAQPIAQRTRYLNAVNTFSELFAMGVISKQRYHGSDQPIQEIRFGDNDSLSAITASMVHADYLFLLTDVEALYTSNPRKDPQARAIDEVESVAEIRKSVSTSTLGSKLGTGGMETKLIAAEIATAGGVATVITSSKNPENVFRIIEYHTSKSAGRTPHISPSSEETAVPLDSDTKDITTSNVSTSDLIRPPHTIFKPSTTPLRDVKSWTAYTLAPAGSVLIDAGAHRVLSQKNSGGRLLAVGVIGVSGEFANGQAVRIVVRKRLESNASGHATHHATARRRSAMGDSTGFGSFDSHPGSPSTPATPKLIPTSLSAMSISALEPFSRPESSANADQSDKVDATPVAGVVTLPTADEIDPDTSKATSTSTDASPNLSTTQFAVEKPKETKLQFSGVIGTEEGWVDIE
ncbi:6635_t:CDS:10, partial [Acaulospora colombiana]